MYTSAEISYREKLKFDNSYLPLTNSYSTEFIYNMPKFETNFSRFNISSQICFSVCVAVTLVMWLIWLEMMYFDQALLYSKPNLH